MSNRGNALGLYDTPPSLCLEGTTPEDRSLIRHYVSFSCSALQPLLQCTATASAVHCIRPCKYVHPSPQVRASCPRKYVHLR